MVVRLVLQVQKKNKSVVCIDPDEFQTSVSNDVDEEGTRHAVVVDRVLT